MDHRLSSGSSHESGLVSDAQRYIVLDDSSSGDDHAARQDSERVRVDLAVHHDQRRPAKLQETSVKEALLRAGPTTTTTIAATETEFLDLSEVTETSQLMATVLQSSGPKADAQSPMKDDPRGKVVEVFPEICDTYLDKLYKEMTIDGPPSPDQIILRVLQAKEPYPKKPPRRKNTLKRKREESPIERDADREHYEVLDRAPSKWGAEASL